jgi:putative transposase
MPGAVKLTVQVKLQPRPQQSEALRHTLETVNEACNWLSKKAWETQEFRQFPLHRAFYKEIRATFDLTAQAVVRLIAKVANAYELDRDVRREFRKHGAIAYDARLLSWNMADSRVSLWSLDGRLDLPFVCSERQRELLAFQRGETTLTRRSSLAAGLPVSQPYCSGSVEIVTGHFGSRMLGYGGGPLQSLAL